MNQATLVIMAAGIGSRFGGGIKQLEPMGPSGEIIMDYSIYDAMEAGFNKVVFVIRKDLEKDFKEIIGNRIAQKVQVEYVFQEVTDIPEKYKETFKDRTKPWGTGQAILVCKELIHEPFVVINADDYYGKEAFKVAYEELMHPSSTSEKLQISMVGFVLKNTLSEHGGVTRGVCKTSADNKLIEIVETSNIVKTAQGAEVQSESGNTPIDVESPVSMNMMGFGPEFLEVLESGFEEFLGQLKPEELKAEYLLPTIVGQLLIEGKAEVTVLKSNDKWFGVTYKEDKPIVVASIQALVKSGAYPESLY